MDCKSCSSTSSNADFHAVACADGKGLFDGIEFAELRELVEHEEETLLFWLRVLLFCFSLCSLLLLLELHISHELREHRVDEEPQDGTQLVGVVRLQDEVEGDFLTRVEEVAQREVGDGCVLTNERILIDRHGGLRRL